MISGILDTVRITGARIAGLLVAIAAALAASGAAPAPAPPRPPKRIVLVTIDTWRSDAIGASGSGRVKTPNLDALAKGGLYCAKAWSSATLTAPSHATILTGLQPYHHGIRDNHGFRLARGTRTLAAALRERGYVTAAFVSAHPLARVSGLNDGFGVYDDHTSPGDPLSLAPRRRPGTETIEAATAWLKIAPDRFFLWVHLYEPHDPYRPPEPYRGTYKDAPYFGAVAYTDELLGRLVAAAGGIGRSDTMWVIAGDHGEGLQDHGESTHSLFVYDATARVPLILFSPGRILPGRVAFARLVDVAPTVLSIAGASPAGLDGRSLLPSSTTADPAYTETMYPYFDFGAAPVRALTDGRYKVIDVPEREVYDLIKDPAERDNLAAAKPVREVQALLARLTSLPGPPQHPAARTDDEDIRALKSLGYIGAGGEYAVSKQGMDPKRLRPLLNKINDVRLMNDARRFTEAIPIYKELIGAFPRSSSLACELGLIEMATDKTADAESHLRLALDLNPDNSHAMLGLANLAIGRKDYSRAETYLLSVLKLDPDDVEANFNLGALYVQSLRTPVKAIPYWRRFLELQPTDPEAPRLKKLLDDIQTGAPRSR